MKRLATIALCLLLSVSAGWAQSGMTDNQIIDYVVEQNAQGVPRQKIVQQLMQRGVKVDQIQRIYKKYQKQMKNGALGAEDITAGSREVKTRMREANGERKDKDKELEKKYSSQYRKKDMRKKTAEVLLGGRERDGKEDIRSRCVQPQGYDL